MMMRRLPLFLLFLACLLGGGLFVHAAYAVDPTVPWQIIIGDQNIDCNVMKGFYTPRVVLCVDAYIRSVTYYFLQAFSDYFLPLTWALITLAIVLFGVKVAAQERELKGEALMLLVKIGLVLFFSYNLGDLAASTFYLIDQSLAMVTRGLEIDSTENFTCQFVNYLPIASDIVGDLGIGGISLKTLPVWAKMDCIVGQIFGFPGKHASTSDPALAPMVFWASALIGLISSTLFSGTIGIMVFMIGLSVIINIVMFVIRSIYIYFIAYLTVAFMIMLSPFIIPMVLIPQSIRQNLSVPHGYFDAWLGYIVNGIITPMVLFGYLAFAYPVYDKFILSKTYESSLYNVLRGVFKVDGSRRPTSAGDPTGDPTAYYTLESSCLKMPSFTDAEFYKSLPNFLNLGSQGNTNVPMSKMQNDPATFFTPDCHGLDLGPEQNQRLWEIGFALLQIMFVGYLLTNMFEMVPAIAGTLAGMGEGITVLAGQAVGDSNLISANMASTKKFIGSAGAKPAASAAAAAAGG